MTGKIARGGCFAPGGEPFAHIWGKTPILGKHNNVILFLRYHIFYQENICMSRIWGAFGYRPISKSFIHWLLRYEPRFLEWGWCPMLPYLQNVYNQHIYVNVNDKLLDFCRKHFVTNFHDMKFGRLLFSLIRPHFRVIFRVWEQWRVITKCRIRYCTFKVNTNGYSILIPKPIFLVNFVKKLTCQLRLLWKKLQFLSIHYSLLWRMLTAYRRERHLWLSCPIILAVFSCVPSSPGLTSANDFVHSIQVYNKSHLCFHDSPGIILGMGSAHGRISRVFFTMS